MLITKALQCAFAAAMGLAICGTAHAEDWKVTGSFGWFAVGKAYQIEKGHVYFVGEFSGTFFNDKGSRYDAAASEDAWGRITKFFGEHIGVNI